MRYSKLLGKTSFSTPHDAESINAKLLTQAGFIDKVSAGIYNYLPLGVRVLTKINKIIREEMNAVGGQEILMPSMHPIALWKTTGRYETWDEVLFKVGKDGDFVLGPSHEETVTPLVKKYVNSYKDLPTCVYQIQTKFRNEPRAKSGLLRGREFGMKDMYSFHMDDKDLDEYYEEVKKAYLKVYERLGLKAYVIEASGGAFTNKRSHEFAVITEAGEDTIVICEKCKTAQNREIASGYIDDPKQNEGLKELKKVDAVRDKSIDAACKLFDIPAWQILKSVVFVTDQGFVGVLIRGDLEVNLEKVAVHMGGPVKLASNEDLIRHGLVPGFISPIDNNKLKFIADGSIRGTKNFNTGANELNKDYLNANLDRDFKIKEFGDFANVDERFKCHECNSTLKFEKAVEAGNIFKLGTKYTDSFDFWFTDKDGKRKKIIMGCYGIGNTRLIGTIVEASHDSNGIIWTKESAPYLVHLISLGESKDVATEAEKIYKDLEKKGIEVLFDDRKESAGKKFKDADLIGIPIRIVVSEKTLDKDSVEWKERDKKDFEMVKIKDLIKKIEKF
jgi:prolyl-tRNA synthetase